MHLCGEAFGILLKICYTFPMTTGEELQGNVHHILTSIASSLLDPYEDYLVERLGQGCHNVAVKRDCSE